MAEVEEASPSPANPDSKTSSAVAVAVCEECKSNESKYKCPGCSIRSCSLHCVKAHKKRTGCSGQRKKTQFLPLSQFNDNLLISDYNLLEDVKRVADSAQRMRVKLCGNSRHFNLPRKLLRKALSRRRTKLLLLPHGMSKRDTNMTYFDNKTKTVFWTIEWHFYSSSTDVKLIDHGVPETSNLSSVIEKHLKPGPWSHSLKQFCLEPLKSLKFFIRKYPKGPQTVFREMDAESPISRQLANLAILEYPLIHVFLPSQSHSFKLIKDSIPRKMDLKKDVIDNTDQSSPKGLRFKEEEIKEDNPSDPKVLDLKKRVKPDGVGSNLDQTRQTKQKTSDTFDGTNLTGKVEDNEAVMNEQECLRKNEENELEWISKTTTDHGDFDDFEFEFDESLVTDNNLVDFLDFEDMLPDDLMMLEGTLDCVDDVSGLVGPAEEEELEEGEIR